MQESRHGESSAQAPYLQHTECATEHIPFSYAHQNWVEPGLTNLGSTQFYEFRSHVGRLVGLLPW